MWWSWALSAASLISLYFLGNGNRTGFTVGLLADAMWAWYSIETQQWGFLVACGAYVVLHVRGFLKWKIIPPSEAWEEITEVLEELEELNDGQSDADEP